MAFLVHLCYIYVETYMKCFAEYFKTAQPASMKDRPKESYHFSESVCVVEAPKLKLSL